MVGPAADYVHLNEGKLVALDGNETAPGEQRGGHEHAHNRGHHHPTDQVLHVQVMGRRCRRRRRWVLICDGSYDVERLVCSGSDEVDSQCGGCARVGGVCGHDDHIGRPLAKVACPGRGALAPVEAARFATHVGGLFAIHGLRCQVVRVVVGQLDWLHDKLIVEHETGAPIQTGIEGTAGGQDGIERHGLRLCWRGHHLCLAVDAREALRAVAPVPAWRNILAGGVVLARLAGATIVEVLVAEDAAPVLLANTLPR